MLTQARLKELLHYDPDTGIFTRISAPPTSKKHIGEIAGSVQKNGYMRICVDGKYYYAHRLAFLYMVGTWPQNKLDHRDRNRANNAWDNIRPASFEQNAANSTNRNKHGLKGVAFRPERNKRPWSAGITIKGIRKHLGYYATKEQAHEAFMAAHRQHYGEFSEP